MPVDLPLKMCEKFIDFDSQLMMVADPQPPNVTTVLMQCQYCFLAKIARYRSK